MTQGQAFSPMVGALSKDSLDEHAMGGYSSETSDPIYIIPPSHLYIDVQHMSGFCLGVDRFTDGPLAYQGMCDALPLAGMGYLGIKSHTASSPTSNNSELDAKSDQEAKGLPPSCFDHMYRLDDILSNNYRYRPPPRHFQPSPPMSPESVDDHPALRKPVPTLLPSLMADLSQDPAPLCTSPVANASYRRASSVSYSNLSISYPISPAETTAAGSPGENAPSYTAADWLESASSFLQGTLSDCQIQRTHDDQIIIYTNAGKYADLWRLLARLKASLPNALPDPATAQPSTTSRNPLYKNKLHKTKTINIAIRVYWLGSLEVSVHLARHSLLRQVADHCINVYLKCWTRYYPVLHKEDFIRWYQTLDNPTDHLVVNAIVVSVAKHALTKHADNGLLHGVSDQSKIRELEEIFFQKARESLAESFDEPQRDHIIAVMLMSLRAQKSKKALYMSMATRMLYHLNITPRRVGDAQYMEAKLESNRPLTSDDDEGAIYHELAFQKELDTRLWWYVWGYDFWAWAAGITDVRIRDFADDNVDYPMVFEEDIDVDEIAVMMWGWALRLWQIQDKINDRFYLPNTEDIDVDDLVEFEDKLHGWERQLPEYFKLDTGFEYGTTDLFQAALVIQREYFATWIMLHKPFIPDPWQIDQAVHNPSGLRSLNKCLRYSLLMLKLLTSVFYLPGGGCAFDLDELWRASEVFIIVIDMVDHLDADSASRLLHGTTKSTLTRALAKSMLLVRKTDECQKKHENFVEFANWLERALLERAILIHSPQAQTTDGRHQVYDETAYVFQHPDGRGEPEMEDAFIPILKIGFSRSTPLEMHCAASPETADFAVKPDPITPTPSSFSKSTPQPSQVSIASMSADEAQGVERLASSAKLDGSFLQSRRCRPKVDVNALAQMSQVSKLAPSEGTTSKETSKVSVHNKKNTSTAWNSRQSSFQANVEPQRKDRTKRPSLPKPPPSIQMRNNSFSFQSPQTSFSKSAPKFRYFNPSTANKYMFIDEFPG